MIMPRERAYSPSGLGLDRGWILKPAQQVGPGAGGPSSVPATTAPTLASVTPWGDPEPVWAGVFPTHWFSPQPTPGDAAPVAPIPPAASHRPGPAPGAGEVADAAPHVGSTGPEGLV